MKSSSCSVGGATSAGRSVAPSLEVSPAPAAAPVPPSAGAAPVVAVKASDACNATEAGCEPCWSDPARGCSTVAVGRGTGIEVTNTGSVRVSAGAWLSDCTGWAPPAGGWVVAGDGRGRFPVQADESKTTVSAQRLRRTAWTMLERSSLECYLAGQPFTCSPINRRVYCSTSAARPYKRASSTARAA
jgi:hypothetical protein